MFDGKVDRILHIQVDSGPNVLYDVTGTHAVAIFQSFFKFDVLWLAH